MSLFKSDPLLAFCRLLAWLILVTTALGCLMAAAAALASVLRGDVVLATLRTAYPALHADGLLLPFALAMTFIALALALLVAFMRNLLAIIRSVAAGEAFTLLNAARIRSLAWISLAGLPLTVCMAAALARTVLLLGPRAPEAGIRVEALPGSTSYGQILMTLLLFVLARLFTQAAAMRDEIEGTV